MNHTDGKQARAKPLQRIGGHTYSSGLDLETKIFWPSGRGGAFFLTSLFIELIDPESAQVGIRLTHQAPIPSMGEWKTILGT